MERRHEGVPLYDALIIGAGPSGSTVARQLARGGWRVLAVDREPAGRDRVCGGFLGPEAAGLWRELDLERSLSALPMAPVRRFLLSGASGARMDTRLPDGGGHGVSRAVFDDWLAARAREAGACVWARTHVSRLHRAAQMVRATLVREGQSQEVCARVLIRAAGRRHVMGRAAGAAGTCFGCKTVYEGVQGLEETVALHFVRQGHVGFNRLPDGRATMCLYVGRRRLMEARGRLDEMMARLADENPAIGAQLRGARRVGEWMSCQAQGDDRELFVQHGAFHVGDAVTMLNPILGGGLSVAMGSSALLARTLLATPLSSLEPSAAAQRYARAWQAQFAGRARFGRWLGWCERHAVVSEGLLRTLSTCPTMVERLVCAARPALRDDALAMAG